MDLVVEVYDLTKTLPGDERYGLTSQIQRAVVSVPANIAEGHSLATPKLFLKHLRIASGSLAEVETQIVLASRLDYLTTSQTQPILNQITDIQKMLFGLTKAIKAKVLK
ncbi:MAG: four helix bundle protein [Planctomycetaceae bacterium]|nr:four helix bundle protein [Planctomycetaceae bacterium]